MFNKTRLINYLLLLFIAIYVVGCSSSDCNRLFENIPPTTATPATPEIPDTITIKKILELEVVYIDNVPIPDVNFTVSSPYIKNLSQVTNSNGQYQFDVSNAPDGAEFPFIFAKDGHVINPVTATLNNGVNVDANTILYKAIAIGYIPLNSGNIEGRVSDLFQEDIALLNYPSGCAMSSDSKKLYISDTSNYRIRVWDFETGLLSTLAGTYISANVDGIGIDARFSQPHGMLVSKDGKYIYVCDSWAQVIRKVDTQTSEVTTFVGSPNIKGLVNGIGNAAQFNGPAEISQNFDGSFLYVSDSQNKIIRKINTVTAEVTSVSTAFPGSVYGIAVKRDTVNNKDIIYVNDTFYNRIYSVDGDTGAKTLLAGDIAGAYMAGGYVDGPALDARFNLPTALQLSPDGNILYVCDYSNNRIRKIDLTTNMVSTLAGSIAGYANGIGSEAQFFNPYSLGLSPNGDILYVADSNNNVIRYIDTATGNTQKLCGGLRAGFNDGPDGYSIVSLSGSVWSVALTSDKNTLYLVDSAEISKFDLTTQEDSIVAASSYTGTVADNNTAYGQTNRGVSHKIVLSADEQTIYLADSTSNMIRSINVATGASTIIAGSTTSGFVDGTGSSARFNVPSSLTLSPDGTTLYVTDANNNRIRKVDIATGTVTTIAGSGVKGFADGIGTAAQFSLPCGIVITPDGQNLYVADAYNHRIRHISLADNNVTTFAGNATIGSTDGIGTAATFDEPRGLALSSDGTLMFVTDGRVSSIRKIDMATAEIRTQADVTTMAGGVYTGLNNGTGAQALLNEPLDITLAQDNSVLYIADNGNSMIRKMIGVFITTVTQ